MHPEKISGRERMLTTLSRREPDRVPYDQSSRSSAIEEEPYNDLRNYLGATNGEVRCFLRSHAQYDEPVRQILGIDTEFIRHFSKEHWRTEPNGQVFVDAWGVSWRKKTGNLYYEIDAYPLGHLEYDDILNQKWPPLVSAELAVRLKVNAEKAFSQTDLALFSDQIGAGLFERAWYLRGLEKFMMDLALDEKHVHHYMEKILEHQLEGYRVLLDAIGPYIQGILLTDDLATQESLLMSRGMYRKMIFPYHKRLLDYLSSRGTKVIFHSCGAVADLLPDLLDAGMEILHPVQRNAAGMTLQKLKKEFPDEFCIWGAGCDIALLQTGSPKEIIEDVKHTLDLLAPGGGFVYSTTHCIQAGTPPVNIIAMIQALKGEPFEPEKFRNYLANGKEVIHGKNTSI